MRSLERLREEKKEEEEGRGQCTHTHTRSLSLSLSPQPPVSITTTSPPPADTHRVSIPAQTGTFGANRHARNGHRPGRSPGSPCAFWDGAAGAVRTCVIVRTGPAWSDTCVCACARCWVGACLCLCRFGACVFQLLRSDEDGIGT
jgi:hypothetical protein